MISRILVPLDGTLLAEHALEALKQVAEPQATVTLVMVSPDGGLPDAADVPGAEHDIDAQQYLDRVASRLQFSGFKTQTEVRAGDPASVIVELSVSHGIEMIVMLAHTRRSGLERMLFGSVSSEVFTNAPCLLLFVPDRIQQRVEQPASATAGAPVEDVTPPDLAPGMAQ
jgi:nucleotide-binding universal stress UspA family protein